MIHLLTLPLRLFWYGLVLLLPLLAFWLSSSMLVAGGAPDWWPWLAGLIAFPGLPLFWELETLVGQALKGDEPPNEEQSVADEVFAFGDRLMLHTLLINGMFLIGLFGFYPHESFTALSTRGDWPLAQVQAPWAEDGRRRLLMIATGLENTYNAVAADPSKAWSATLSSLNGRSQPGNQLKATAVMAANAASPKGPSWPPTAELHPAIARMPKAAEASVQTIAAHIAKRERDPHRRVKAIYDFVASRVAYDVEALRKGRYPAQDPQTVLRTRKAVCAGYARLFMAIAHEMGLLAVYVTGDARDAAGTVPPGAGHAWNAVKVGKFWYLLDPTWGAGSVENHTFTRHYNPAYLFTPPEVFALDHLPDEPQWQLRRKPISAEAFKRQPLLRAGFFARGLRLADPVSMPLQVHDRLQLRFHNPARQYLIAGLKPVSPADGGEASCRITGTRELSLDCSLPHPGTWKLELFSNQRSYGSFDFVGEIKVEAR